MIGVLTTGPLEGRALSIYNRVLRYTGNAEKYQVFTGRDEIPQSIKTVILLDDFDSYLTKVTLGRKIPIHKARGYRYEVDGRVYIPTYSPFVLNGRMNYFPVVIWDFRKALASDGKHTPDYPFDDLITHPSPEQFRIFCEAVKMMEFITVDLETPTEKDEESDEYATTILRASLAGADGTAVSFPWFEPFIGMFTDLMASPVPKVFWNGWRFDQPILAENEIPLNGRIYDAMWLYHFLQPTLPKSLGAVSTIYADCPEWKSLNNDQPELYSAMDAWATVKCFQGIRASLQKRGTWDLAERHVTDLLYVLDEMSARGIRVSQEGIDSFNGECDRKLAALQEKFNTELPHLRPYLPKQKDGTFGYKNPPKDTTGLVRVPVTLGGAPVPGEPIDPLGSVTYEMRWARQEDFLATSLPQMLRYFDSKGYPHHGKADEGVISSLARKHKDPLLFEFIKFRELKKMRGTYGGFPIGADGRVHTTFTLRPDTHRLSSIKPNCQNIPKNFKHVFIPSPGCKLLEADLSSVEAVLTGFFAGDTEYMRRAKIGIHKIAMAQYLGVPVDFTLSDGEISVLVDPMKDKDPDLYRKIKVIIYGGNYLAGAKTIYENNAEDFKSQSEAKAFLRFCQSLSPKIPAWQRRTVEQAAIQHGLTNPWGYYKAFWNPNDGPAACAFMPQSTCAAIMKEILLDLAKKETGRYLVLTVHDSIVADVPNDRVEFVTAEIREAMTRPWPQLGGLAIGCDIKVGDSLKL